MSTDAIAERLMRVTEASVRMNTSYWRYYPAPSGGRCSHEFTSLGTRIETICKSGITLSYAAAELERMVKSLAGAR